MTTIRLLAIMTVAWLTACRPAAQPPAPAPAAPASRAPNSVQPPPIERELRGVWVSAAWPADWPSRRGLTPDSQRAELRALFDGAQQLGLNAVMLHVRIVGDALYPTGHAPWSMYVSGERGRAPDPYYDPLAFAVAEAHRRGIELHAWFNPFRAAVAGQPNPRIEHPEWVVSYATQKWIDPGIPEARHAVLAAILEVVDRYDVDGIHLDDYFYPYLEQDASGRTLTFPDDASWSRYGTRFASRPDWRRANIDSFVESLYHQVKARKSWVRVGISPFGIWRPNHPTGITGLNAYSEIFADARKWLRSGWVDYMAPQLYWPLAGPQHRFARLDSWWQQQNTLNRHVWPGLHTQRETVSSSRWPAGEIARQIASLRAARGGTQQSNGHVHFRYNALLPIAQTLRAASYAVPAITPAMPWLDARTPAAPMVRMSQGLLLRAQAADSVPVRWFAVQELTGGGRWQLSILRADSNGAVSLNKNTSANVIAVRALSPTGMESAPTTVVRDE